MLGALLSAAVLSKFNSAHLELILDFRAFSRYDYELKHEAVQLEYSGAAPACDLGKIGLVH